MGYLRFVWLNRAWLAVGLLLAFTSSFGQTFFISIFSAEIMAEFGLSHGGWGTIYSAGTAASALAMIWAGGLSDRFRVRHLAPAVFVALALSALAMAFNRNAWLVPLVVLALRFTGQGMCSQLAAVSMVRWFNASRGRALAISAMGFALGNAMLPFVFVQAKAIFDWRSLWVIAALIAAAAILPLLPLLRHERQPGTGPAVDGSAGMDGRHWTRSEMLREPLFWLLLPSIIGPAAWNTALFFWQVHLSEAKGWAHADFVALLPLFTLVAVLSTFASGWAVDRFGAGWLMVLLGLPLSLGFALLWAAGDLAAAAVAMSMLALGSGALATLPGSFAAEFFGTRYLGGINAVWTSAMVLGSAAGPGITGWAITFGFGFPSQSLVIAGYFVLSAGLLALGIGRARSRLPAAAQIDIEGA